MKLKKAISPVVAIALLLVISVIAVVGYQSWYTGYQSILTSDVEQKSSSDSINIDFISKDRIVYITNTGTKNISMSNIKVGNIDCNLNQNLSPGVNNISIAFCLNKSGTNEIILITENGIIEEKIFIENNLNPINTENIFDIFQDNSIIAMYQFNNNANDLNGVHNGVPTNINYDTGKFANSSVYNGATSQVLINNNILPNTFTFSIWFYPDINGRNSFASLPYPNPVYWNLMIAPNEKIYSNLLDSNNINDGGFYSVNTVNINQWNHLVLIVDRTTDSQTIYLNGAYESNITSIGYTGNFLKSLYIGRDQRNNEPATDWFSGKIDQIRIFNKTVTLEEVQTLYTESLN